MHNFIVKIEENNEGIYSRYFQADSINVVVNSLIKERGYKLKPKGYSTQEEQGHRCVFHTWQCTHGIVIYAHEVYV